jgi:peptidoglycan hydrolase-like protein with peptidoglycan-binding domain
MLAVHRRGSKGRRVEEIQARLRELGYYRGTVDGDYGPNSEKAVKAFQRSRGLDADGEVGPATGAALFSLPGGAGETTEPLASTARLNHQRLGRLHPVLAIRGRCLNELCAHDGIAVLVTQGLRTWEEQSALYAKGRTVPPIGRRFIVTRARGGRSFHNFGLAFDIVVLDALGKADWDASHPGWKRAGDLGQSVGLGWGGAWTSFRDPPHFQYAGGLSTADCRALYRAGGLPAVWERVA